MTDKLPLRTSPRIVRFLQARLSPAGYLGLHLTVGLAVVLIAGWGFAEIAEGVVDHEAITRIDESVALWFHHQATPGLTVAARVPSFVGSVAFVTVASVVVALGMAWKRWWNRSLVFALTMAGGSVLNLLLKHFFHRQRPILENPLVTLMSYGFPSGHTMGATIFYGILRCFALQLVKRTGYRTLIVIAASVVVALVGTSRLYLGAHYFSDVIGAIAVGAAWLGFCWTGNETLRRRKLQPRISRDT